MEVLHVTLSDKRKNAPSTRRNWHDHRRKRRPGAAVAVWWRELHPRERGEDWEPPRRRGCKAEARRKRPWRPCSCPRQSISIAGLQGPGPRFFEQSRGRRRRQLPPCWPGEAGAPVRRRLAAMLGRTRDRRRPARTDGPCSRRRASPRWCARTTPANACATCAGSPAGGRQEFDVARFAADQLWWEGDDGVWVFEYYQEGRRPKLTRS